MVTSLRDSLDNARSATDVLEAHAEIAETLRLLRDDLFTHFAREEEGLFPLVVAELPDLDGTVSAVVGAHDRICGAVSRMTHVLEKGPELLRQELDALHSVFERFDETFSAHSREEVELLHSLSRRLNPRQRAALAEMMKTL